MYARKYRLHLQKDFERVFHEGRSFYGNCLSIRICESAFLYQRFGIVVSNKVSKKATVRNKVKRRLREILRGNIPNYVMNRDIIVLTKKGIEEYSFEQIKQELEMLLKKAKLLRDSRRIRYEGAAHATIH
jgi:ribonuclease P protein component